MNPTTHEPTTLSALLTVREAADLLRISERTLFTLTKNREIPSVRVGRGVRYDERDLARWIEAQKTC
jgi:excisionase family DNA binding protein